MGVREDYKAKAIDVAKVSNNSLIDSEKRVKNLSLLIKKELLDYKEGKFLPSNISDIVLKGKVDNLYQASLLIAKSEQIHNKIREFMQTEVEPKVITAYDKLHHLRQSLKAEFMSDVDVNAEIKTIKHQEILFEDIFKDFLGDFRELRTLKTATLASIQDFLRQNMFALNGLSKFLYNIDQLQAVELNIQKDVILLEEGRSPKPKKDKKKKKFSKKDLD